MRREEFNTTATGGTRTTRKVLVRFADDEIIEGDLVGFDLDAETFELCSPNAASNSRRAIVPLTSVKRLSLSRGHCSPETKTDGHEKVALRFWDGESLRGFLVDGPHHHRHGFMVSLLDLRHNLEVLAIPYLNFKALYYVTAWETTTPEYTRETGRWSWRRHEPPLVELIGEVRRLGRLREQGYLSDAEYHARRRDVLERL
jgi:hypothetical protein